MLNESFTQHMDAIKSCSTKQQCSVKVYLRDILHPYVSLQSGDFFFFFFGGGGEGRGKIHSIKYSIPPSPPPPPPKKNCLIVGYPYVFLDFLASVCTSLLRFSAFDLVAQMRFFMLNQITKWGSNTNFTRRESLLTCFLNLL